MKKYILLIIPVVLALGIIILSCIPEVKKENEINTKVIEEAELLAGLEFTAGERDSMLTNLIEFDSMYRAMRAYEISNCIPPAFVFNPLPSGFKSHRDDQAIEWILPDDVVLPEDKSELAFYPVYKLASLIRSGRISAVELTELYLERLKQYGDTLHCVVTLTEDLALKQAAKADRELAEGIYRGPLHGIPYGVKDLFAVEGYRTTWGATPFTDQVIDQTATIVTKLSDAGAVLVAKLTLGALAMGDVWYGGITRNPWDTKQGSSGSSAGSASATAAGLVGFAIGTETWGSIVSPSSRCGVTGLRPTFGRVSRNNAMALSWTMDKIGPICRSVYDCALVFDVIRGVDPLDPFTVEADFDYDTKKDLQKLKIAYLEDFFKEDYLGHTNDSITLEHIRGLGFEIIPVDFPDNLPVGAMVIALLAEASAAFDELTRSNKDDLLVAQHRGAWPNIFRYARFIPAVEYIQANRLRTLLIEQLHKFMQEFDVVITPSFGGDQLLATNLTGQPCVVIPNGFDEEGHPTSISFIGNLFDEASLLEFADYVQRNSEWDDVHPEKFKK